ncbi:hypothetical protein [Desulfosediminicola flagellatus]|uniref:hypothetical protein n=1 Tax=Desulfosediminicola flagellatus TaxID=2569541 RepID=UPI0010AD2553|nr:hypothetical protein [Desulfosediminicola flagellatus]
MRRIAIHFIVVLMLLILPTISQAAEQTATGSYLYNSSDNTLTVSILESSFICDGPIPGDEYSMIDVSITQSDITWTEIEDGESDIMTWQRTSAETGGIIGEWSRTHNDEQETLKFLSGNQVEIIGGDSEQCPEGTGTHTASGTYTYNPGAASDQLTVDFTSSDFSCEGPEIGTESFTVATLTETYMTWDMAPGEGQMELFRESGVAGIITGTWRMEDKGNIYTVTINNDGTFTIVGQIYQCDNEGEPDGAYISTNHFESSYWVDIRVVDQQGTITGVTVEGTGITTPIQLTSENPENTRWVSWQDYNSELHFDNGLPTELPSYTVTIARGSENTVETLDVTGFLTEFPQPVAPAVDANLDNLQDFSWEGLGQGYQYSIWIYSDNGDFIWENNQIEGTTVSYTGPDLESGSYSYNLQVNGPDGNGSFIRVPFTIGSGVELLFANGSYAPNTQTLTIESSDYLCDGPLAGEQFSAGNITETSMTLMSLSATGYPLEWVRESGTAGNITGTWTLVVESSVILIVHPDYSFTLEGNKPECHDIEAYVWSNNYDGQYAIQMEINDPDNKLISVSVLEEGVTIPVNLYHDEQANQWVSWSDTGIELFVFGATHPDPPLNYTLKFTWQNGENFTRDFTVTNFIEHVAVPVFPLPGTYINALTEISWTRDIAIADNTISVDLYDNTGVKIWRARDIHSNLVVYTGPSLVNGKYKYRIKVWDDQGNSSKIKVPFHIGAPKGDLNGNYKLDVVDAILALKVLTGQDTGVITSETLLDGDTKVGIGEAIYIIKEISNIQ